MRRLVTIPSLLAINKNNRIVNCLPLIQIKRHTYHNQNNSNDSQNKSKSYNGYDLLGGMVGGFLTYSVFKMYEKKQKRDFMHYKLLEQYIIDRKTESFFMRYFSAGGKMLRDMDYATGDYSYFLKMDSNTIYAIIKEFKTDILTTILNTIVNFNEDDIDRCYCQMLIRLYITNFGKSAFNSIDISKYGNDDKTKRFFSRHIDPYVTNSSLKQEIKKKFKTI